MTTADTCRERTGEPLAIPMGGGANRRTIGPGRERCGKPCVPGMVVCLDHATKDALLLLLQSKSRP